MSTDPFTTHRHTQSKTGTTASAGGHAHTTTDIDKLISDLQTRVANLEKASAPPAPTGLTALPGNGMVSLAWVA